MATDVLFRPNPAVWGALNDIVVSVHILSTTRVQWFVNAVIKAIVIPGGALSCDIRRNLYSATGCYTPFGNCVIRDLVYCSSLRCWR
ncbi:hypothetical protein KCP70_17785 [Salmonella enterica subsp. enterica]|nr:hypothetical protein KCP70_17785 [Salmonella enterica subsp. enterica]